MSEQHEQFDPRMRHRLQVLYSYSMALEHGDFDTVSAALHEAEYDAVLERMILELHDASLEPTPPMHAGDVQPLHAFLHTYLPTQEAAENGALNGSPSLRHGSSLFLNQERVVKRIEDELSTSENVLPKEQEQPHHPTRKKRKHPHLHAFFQGLAAVLVVGMLLSGFVALLAYRQSITGNAGGTPMTTQSSVLTVATYDGTIYALQPQSGAVLWHYATHQEVDMMVQQDGAVYVSTSGKGTRPNYLYKFRVSNGTLLWEKHYPLLEGYSIIAVEDDAIAISGGEGDGSMDVVNASDGSVMWRYVPERNGSRWTDPIIGVHTNVVYIRVILPNSGFSNGGIKAYQIRTGKLLWTSTAVPQVDTLVFSDETIYAISSDNHTITTLDEKNGQAIKTLKFPSDEYPIQGGFADGILYVNTGVMTESTQVCAVRLTDGAHLWCSSKALNTTDVFMPPVIMNTTFYYYQTAQDGLSNRVQAIALHTSNGRLRWHWTSPEKHLYSSVNLVNIVGLNGTIYMTTSQGIFALSGSDGHLLWHVLADINLQSFALPSVPGQTYQLPN